MTAPLRRDPNRRTAPGRTATSAGSAERYVSGTRPRTPSTTGTRERAGRTERGDSGTRLQTPPTTGTPECAATNERSVSGTRPQTLTDRLETLIDTLAHSQYELVVLAAEFADSPEWILTSSPTPAHWLAAIADVEQCTAREWIRIGRLLGDLPAIAEAFRTRCISYSKVRTLTRLATPDNEHELLHIATDTTAADLGRALAAWLHDNTEPEEIDAYHRRQRSVKWRTEPDGMVLFTLRLPPAIAAVLIAFLTTWIMRTRPKPAHDQTWPTSAQQKADAIEALLTDGTGSIDTEVVLHVRGDGCTLDDGTPISESAVAAFVLEAFIRALIHDSNGDPIDATNRRRHPTPRQARLVDEQQPACVDCGRTELLEYDHVPPYELTKHTITTELRRRCAPCHTKRHRTS